MIKEIFGRLGIYEVGFVTFDSLSANLIDCRATERLPQNAQSVIVALFPYLLPEYSPRRNAARFAVVPDYHEVVGGLLGRAAAELKGLYPEHSFVPFTDNSPIPEAAAAQAAGLGEIGLHGLLINRRLGTFFAIGELVTTLPVDAAPAEQPGASLCTGCGRCVKACPAGVLPDGNKKTSCISCLTQKKGELTPEETALIRKSGLAWGCDICQEVCPANMRITAAPLKEFTHCAPQGVIEHLTADMPLEGRAFAWRGRETLCRNLCILEEET